MIRWRIDKHQDKFDYWVKFETDIMFFLTIIINRSKQERKRETKWQNSKYWYTLRLESLEFELKEEI